jgi:hypothetical protein
MTPQQARDAYVWMGSARQAEKTHNRYEHFKPARSPLTGRARLIEVRKTEILWHPYANHTTGNLPLVKCLVTNEIGDRSGFWRSTTVDYLEIQIFAWDAVTVYIHREYDYPMTFVPKDEELQRMFFCDDAIPVVTILKKGYFDGKEKQTP